MEPELTENDLYLDGAAEDWDDKLSEGSEQEEGDLESSSPLARHSVGVDIAGTSAKSESILSSTLNASLEELGDADAALCGVLDRARMPFMVAASLPARTSAVQMGSSVPIAIPSMARFKPPGEQPSSEAAAPGGPAAAAAVAVTAARPIDAPTPGKFVPPHQLVQQEDFTFSFAGASPSACLKRERLRTRNAILRSTGFLEPHAGVAQSLPAPSGMEQFAQQRQQQQQQQQQLKSEHPHSSLTAALSSAALTPIGEAA